MPSHTFSSSTENKPWFATRMRVAGGDNVQCCCTAMRYFSRRNTTDQMGWHTIQPSSKRRLAYLGSLRSSGGSGGAGTMFFRALFQTIWRLLLAQSKWRSLLEARESRRTSRGSRYPTIWWYDRTSGSEPMLYYRITRITSNNTSAGRFTTYVRVSMVWLTGWLRLWRCSTE